jgi:hypothetical protein
MEKRERSKIDFDEALKALAPLLRPTTPDADATLAEAMGRDLGLPPVKPFLLVSKEGPTAVTQTVPDAAPQPGFKNDQFASHRPSIGRRTFRTLARFFIAALIGVGAGFAWLYHGDEKSRPDIDVAAEQTGSTPAGQMSARDAAPQSTPVTQTAPAPAAAAISPELVRQFEDMARDLAVMRNSVEQLAAKQEQMAQNIATLQAAEQDIIQKMSSPPLSGPVPLPPRKKAPRVAPPKPAAQSSSAPPPALLPR